MAVSGAGHGRALVRAALGLLAAVALVACTASKDSGSGPPPPTPPATQAQSTAQPQSTTPAEPTTDNPSPGPASPSARGCPATGATVPPGAATAPTADLDGDGATDTLWLSAGVPRILGVRTHSGAVFSVGFSSGAPQAARATGQRLADGSAILLLDTGRAVPLYAVVDCAIVAARNVQGHQYTFDLGLTGYGTGVACEDLGAGTQLVGLNATSADGQTFDVTLTAIDLAERGTTATNGRTATIATGVPADDPAVAAAHEVSCADAPPPVVEP